jgi:hypothetical protein
MIHALFLACAFLEPPPDPDCTDRIAAWPDADGDGVGDPTEVYVGCHPPDGWVQIPPPTDTSDTGTTPGTP